MTNLTPQGLSKEALDAVIARSPYSLDLGVQIASYAPGNVVITLPVRERFTQHHGFVHGSIVGFMADTACSWVAASVVGDVVTSEYKLNLLAPATGDSLLARGSVIKAGSRQVVTRADVFARKDDVERIVATALATVVRV